MKWLCLVFLTPNLVSSIDHHIPCETSAVKFEQDFPLNPLQQIRDVDEDDRRPTKSMNGFWCGLSGILDWVSSFFQETVWNEKAVEEKMQKLNRISFIRMSVKEKRNHLRSIQKMLKDEATFKRETKNLILQVVGDIIIIYNNEKAVIAINEMVSYEEFFFKSTKEKIIEVMKELCANANAEVDRKLCSGIRKNIHILDPVTLNMTINYWITLKIRSLTTEEKLNRLQEIYALTSYDLTPLMKKKIIQLTKAICADENILKKYENNHICAKIYDEVIIWNNISVGTETRLWLKKFEEMSSREKYDVLNVVSTMIEYEMEFSQTTKTQIIDLVEKLCTDSNAKNHNLCSNVHKKLTIWHDSNAAVQIPKWMNEFVHFNGEDSRKLYEILLHVEALISFERKFAKSTKEQLLKLLDKIEDVLITLEIIWGNYDEVEKMKRKITSLKEKITPWDNSKAVSELNNIRRNYHENSSPKEKIQQLHLLYAMATYQNEYTESTKRSIFYAKTLLCKDQKIAEDKYCSEIETVLR